MADKMALKVGIIGGTGFDDPLILTDRQELNVPTPFGATSAPLINGTISGVPCVLLLRHGLKHEISPTHVPFRANIHALKSVGCTHLLATTACGSLREEIVPGEVLVVLDQFIDRTTKRHSTFYDGTTDIYEGVCHIPMAEPFCHHTRHILSQSCTQLGYKFLKTGTVVTIEGPRFSTKAESKLYQNWNCDVINMTTVPEVTLATELGMSYAALALPTDYDCWRDGTESVTVENVLKVLKVNGGKAKEVIVKSIENLKESDWLVVSENNRRKAVTSVM
ncbi:S-methyl-5'-thioadenosine phosphorylase-like [Oopsacas minuta]|uniref:S-methyl-5'-thioadenosine phosphorylase n=1 Tax=Oopsacas minuta TaxID=111878 RepID=A0AAV7K8V9_9METZ|nr:S-methyl-5'-thioadenosine phosphorylase-like [Oopsacas minuta]